LTDHEIIAVNLCANKGCDMLKMIEKEREKAENYAHLQRMKNSGAPFANLLTKSGFNYKIGRGVRSF